MSLGKMHVYMCMIHFLSNHDSTYLHAFDNLVKSGPDGARVLLVVCG